MSLNKRSRKVTVKKYPLVKVNNPLRKKTVATWSKKKKR